MLTERAAVASSMAPAARFIRFTATIPTVLARVFLIVENGKRLLSRLRTHIVHDLLQTSPFSSDCHSGLDLGGGDSSMQLGNGLTFHLVHCFLSKLPYL
jgi:hypothetical protein